jgi:ribonuclease BN (tRNA processing enzyme)
VRTEPLPIIGPSGNSVASGPAGNDVAPDFSTFLARLFDDKNGAFPAMGGTLGGRGNGVRLNVSVVDVKKVEPSTVFEGHGLRVTALGIPHADMPTLAYRVETGDGSIVFSSDQNGTNPKFVDFAKNANVLIMHLAIAAGATSPLHAAPAVVGRLAQEAHVGRLIVSHIGQFDLDAAIADLRKSYTGLLTIGADLQCTPIAR